MLSGCLAFFATFQAVCSAQLQYTVTALNAIHPQSVIHSGNS